MKLLLLCQMKWFSFTVHCLPAIWNTVKPAMRDQPLTGDHLLMAVVVFDIVRYTSSNKRTCLNKCAPTFDLWCLRNYSTNLNHIFSTWNYGIQGPLCEIHWNQSWIRIRFLPPRLMHLFGKIQYYRIVLIWNLVKCCGPVLLYDVLTVGGWWAGYIFDIWSGTLESLWQQMEKSCPVHWSVIAMLALTVCCVSCQGAGQGSHTARDSPCYFCIVCYL